MKKQFSVYLDEDFIRQIDSFIQKENPKYSDRSHFFEVAATELMKVGSGNGGGS